MKIQLIIQNYSKLMNNLQINKQKSGSKNESSQKQLQRQLSEQKYKDYINSGMSSRRLEGAEDAVSSQMNNSIQQIQIMENENIRRKDQIPAFSENEEEEKTPADKNFIKVLERSISRPNSSSRSSNQKIIDLTKSQKISPFEQMKLRQVMSPSARIDFLIHNESGQRAQTCQSSLGNTKKIPNQLMNLLNPKNQSQRPVAATSTGGFQGCYGVQNIRQDTRASGATAAALNIGEMQMTSGTMNQVMYQNHPVVTQYTYGGLNLVPQQSTALSTLRGQGLGFNQQKSNYQGQHCQILPLQNPRPIQKPNPLQNIQRIIQNNICETDLEKKNKRKNTHREGQETVRSIQLQNQPTERLHFHYDKKFNHPQQNIKKTLESLQKQSPFNNLSPRDKLQRKNLFTNDSPNQEGSELFSSNTISPLKHSNSESDENTPLMDNLNVDIPTAPKQKFKLDLAKLTHKTKSPVKREVVPVIFDMEEDKESVLTYEDNNKPTSRRQSATKSVRSTLQTHLQNSEQIKGSNSSTARQSLHMQSRGDSLSNTPCIRERTEEEEEHSVDDTQQYFNLKVYQTGGVQKTLSQQIKEQLLQQDTSMKESSFDSINPDELIRKSMGPSTTSNYASHVSGASKLKRGNLYTKSSNYSSIYSKVESSVSEDKIETCLKKIDRNIQTFTTDQFLDLRNMVKEQGYKEADINGQNAFGLEKGVGVEKVLRKPEEKDTLARYLLLGDQQILCTGFLSTPNIVVDPESLENDEPGDNKHKASSQEGSFLLSELMSPEILQLFSKESCKIVSCGFEHCLALVENGQIYTWGYGGSGCLGHHDYQSYEKPKRIEGAEVASYAQAGGYHNAFISETKKVFTWGRGDVGQLGILSGLSKDKNGVVSLQPQQIEFQQNIKQLALGDAHSLFLTESCEVLSCGWFQRGQLGISQEQKESDEKNDIILHKVTNLKGIKQISCGAIFSMALTHQGDIYAWGGNSYGQIEEQDSARNSDLSSQSRDDSIPLPKKLELSKVQEILAGDGHVLARSEKKIYAWGQGILASQETGETQEVVCKPNILGGGIDNKMKFSLQKKELSRTTEKVSIPSPDLQIKLEATLGTQRLQDLPDLQNSKKVLSNTQKTSKLSNTDDDLTTIKNTDDYNNFLHKREEDECRILMGATGSGKQQLMNMIYRESSPRTFGTHGQNSERDAKGTDLITVEEEIPRNSMGLQIKDVDNQQYFHGSHLQVSQQYRTDQIKENEQLLKEVFEEEEPVLNNTNIINRKELLVYSDSLEPENPPFNFLSLTEESKPSGLKKVEQPQILINTASHHTASKASEISQEQKQETMGSIINNSPDFKAREFNPSTIKKADNAKDARRSFVTTGGFSAQQNKMQRLVSPKQSIAQKLSTQNLMTGVLKKRNHNKSEIMTSPKGNKTIQEVLNREPNNSVIENKQLTSIQQYDSSPLDISSMDNDKNQRNSTLQGPYSSQLNLQSDIDRNMPSVSQLSVSQHSYPEPPGTGQQRMQNQTPSSHQVVVNSSGGTGETCRAPKPRSSIDMSLKNKSQLIKQGSIDHGTPVTTFVARKGSLGLNIGAVSKKSSSKMSSVKSPRMLSSRTVQNSKKTQQNKSPRARVSARNNTKQLSSYDLQSQRSTYMDNLSSRRKSPLEEKIKKYSEDSYRRQQKNN